MKTNIYSVNSWRYKTEYILIFAKLGIAVMNSKRYNARQHDNIVLSDMEKNLQWPKMKLCEYFGCSTSDHIEGICGHTNKQTDRRFLYFNKMQSIKGDM